MQSIIHLLIIAALFCFLLALLYALHKWIEYRQFKSKYKKGSLVIYYLGHKRRNGKIVRIRWNRAEVRDFFDQNIYTKVFYQILDPNYHADTK